MITKILFTLAVIAAVIALVRFRSRPVPAVLPVAAKKKPSPWIKWIAYAVISLMLATSAVFLYLHWREARQVVQITVIDGVSGRKTQYQAYRGGVESHRFETIDGRQVILSNTDRMEVGSAP